MDELDLLESLVALVFGLLPLIGITLRRRFMAVIFEETAFKLSEENKEEIVKRMEFVNFITTTFAAGIAVGLSILAYYHKNIAGVLLSIIVVGVGLGYALSWYGKGANKFESLSEERKHRLAAIPVLLLLVKLVVVAVTVGVLTEGDDPDAANKLKMAEAHVKELESDLSRKDEELSQANDRLTQVTKELDVLKAAPKIGSTSGGVTSGGAAPLTDYFGVEYLYPSDLMPPVLYLPQGNSCRVFHRPLYGGVHRPNGREF